MENLIFSVFEVYNRIFEYAFYYSLFYSHSPNPTLLATLKGKDSEEYKVQKNTGEKNK